MQIDHQEIAKRYAEMNDSELMEIAASYDSLTGVAQDALRAEFSTRKLEPPNVADKQEALPRKWVTIRRYRDLSEAIVARTLLESASIAVFLQDENLVRLDWQVSNFIGGIRLQVEAADEASALDILSEPIIESISFGELADFQQPHCPRCESADIMFQGASRGAAITSTFLLGIPLPLGEETWLCNCCEARWVDEGNEPIKSGMPA